MSSPVKSILSSALLAVLYAVMGTAAALLRLFRWRGELLHSHLERCMPELDDARRRAVAAGFYRYLGEFAAEVLYERLLDRETLARRVRFENRGAIDALLRDGRRVLILSAHHSNWEWLLLRCSSGFDAPLTTAYKVFKRKPRLDAFVRSLRARFGGVMVPSRQFVTYLLEQRGQARLLAMLADQSPAADNEQQSWREFFGQQTAFYSGPGWIAARMGYVPFFAAMKRERRGHYSVRFIELPCAGRADPEQVLQAYALALEQHVRACPEEYFWAYNRWKREKPLYG